MKKQPFARSTGRSNKLVGQTGEYLVAAELSRRGLIATTFTGNVPHYDIIASDEKGRHVAVQVKTSSGISWQFGDITRFCEMSMRGKRQIFKKPKRSPVIRLVVVLVALQPDRQTSRTKVDRFFVMNWRDLRSAIIKHHKYYLKRWGGIRPNNPESFHVAISATGLTKHRDRWDVVTRSLS